MTLFGSDPVDVDLQRVLQRLLDGDIGPAERLESRRIDLKEDSDRRGQQGQLVEPPEDRDPAMRKLAGEAVCMANTLGGGALIVGAADDGSLVGATLDGERLRHRIYELTQNTLTVVPREVVVRGVRLLVLRCPEAIHPIAWQSRFQHRVDDHCVDVDASTWEHLRRDRAGYDWSALASTVPSDSARPAALQRARDFLRAAGDQRSNDLATARDADLLRRLNVLTGDGTLTNAGVLALVGRTDPALDYHQRRSQGGDSVVRIDSRGLGLLEELHDVFTAIEAASSTVHVPVGLVQRQVKVLPSRAAREAVVNGVAHRDWYRPEPTLVEHFPNRFVVSSPGGFVGGVTSENIITHPSQSPNRALTELLAALHVAEREGIGVDRMVGDMLRLGYPAPTISEVEGPYVRAALVGGRPDLPWMSFLDALEPREAGDDLDVLLLLRRLVDEWWVDAPSAGRLLQRQPVEAEEALATLRETTVDGASIVEPVAGVPAGAIAAWQVTEAAMVALRRRYEDAGTPRGIPARASVATSWANGRGRISSTELASLVGAHSTNVQSVLKGLEDDGVLAPGRESRRGRGFFYVPTG